MPKNIIGDWNEEEQRIAYNMFYIKHESIKAISKRLKRSPQAICYKLHKIPPDIVTQNTDSQIELILPYVLILAVLGWFGGIIWIKILHSEISSM